MSEKLENFIKQFDPDFKLNKKTKKTINKKSLEEYIKIFEKEKTAKQKIISFTLIPNTEHKSVYENRIFDNFRAGINMTWGNLVDTLLKEKHQIYKKKEESMFFIPSSFKRVDYTPAKYTESDEKHKRGIAGEPKYDEDGNTWVGRYGENVDLWYMIPADIDDGMTIKEAKHRFQNCEYIGYTSFNHLKEGAEKFRLLFLLKDPVGNKEFQNRRDAIKEFLGDGIDTTCLSAARGFYWASCSEETKENAHVWHNPGKQINLLKFEENKEFEIDLTEYEDITDEEKLDLLDKLRSTPMPDYDHWWKMISAMITTGYSMNDLIHVSGNNPLHAGKHGLKSMNDCQRYWKQVIDFNNRVGGISPGFLWNFVNGAENKKQRKKPDDILQELLEKFDDG